MILVNESNLYELYEAQMDPKKRASLKASQFGLPKDRKYPLDTPERTLSAIKFFNYCADSKKKELADNIIKAIKKYKLKPKVGKTNSFLNYYRDVKN